MPESTAGSLRRGSSRADAGFAVPAPTRRSRGTRTAGGTRRTGGLLARLRIHDLPVRSRLFLTIAIPAAAFLSLAIFGATTWLADATGYGHGVRAATLGRDLATTVHELQRERDLSAGYIAGGRDKRPDAGEWSDRLAAQRRSVDSTMERIRGALAAASDDFGSAAGTPAERALRGLDALSETRDMVGGAGLPLGAVLNQYSLTIADLRDFDRAISPNQKDGDLGQSAAVLRALSDVKEIDSQIRGELYAAAFVNRFDFGQADSLTNLLAQDETAVAAFRDVATADDRALYERIVNGQAVLTVERITDRAVSRQQLPDLDVDPEQWFAASTTHIELLRTVESRLLENVIDEAGDLQSEAWQRTALIGGFILAITLAAVGLTLAIAGTMTRPLRALRAGAHEVAHERLPQLIEELRTSNPDRVDTAVRPIGIDSRDEIGELARTFDELQREAVRLATEQASLRRNVNTLFLSLSRRSQSLIERQLSLIDRLESAEENPHQLENLFRLDHLATRMRRNSENLLVLAGTGPGRRRSTPVSLPCILQAACGEIEQYQRVHIIDVVDVRVAAAAVNHIVHLVAELLENAAQFSPPQAPVDLAATMAADGGVLVTITDSGLGIPVAELDAANERLADPPLFDFSIAERLGLFVVARLAARHDVSVRLTPAETGGVRALVHLPPQLLVAASAARGSGPGRVAAAVARAGSPAAAFDVPGSTARGGTAPEERAAIGGMGSLAGSSNGSSSNGAPDPGEGGQDRPGTRRNGQAPLSPAALAPFSPPHPADSMNLLDDVPNTIVGFSPSGLPIRRTPGAGAPGRPDMPGTGRSGQGIAGPGIRIPDQHDPGALEHASPGTEPSPSESSPLNQPGQTHPADLPDGLPSDPSQQPTPGQPAVNWFRPRGPGGDGTASTETGGTGEKPSASDRTGRSGGSGGTGPTELPPIRKIVADRERERRRQAPSDGSGTGSAAVTAGATSATSLFDWFSRSASPPGPTGSERQPVGGAHASGAAVAQTTQDMTTQDMTTQGFEPMDAAESDTKTGDTKPSSPPGRTPQRPATGFTVESMRDSSGGTTGSGLPIRVPAATVRPGQAQARTATAPGDAFAGWDAASPAAQPAVPPEEPDIAPEWIRGRLSRLYEGVNHARGTETDGSQNLDDDPPGTPDHRITDRPNPLDRLEDE